MNTVTQSRDWSVGSHQLLAELEGTDLPSRHTGRPHCPSTEGAHTSTVFHQRTADGGKDHFLGNWKQMSGQESSCCFEGGCVMAFPGFGHLEGDQHMLCSSWSIELPASHLAGHQPFPQHPGSHSAHQPCVWKPARGGAQQVILQNPSMSVSCGGDQQKKLFCCQKQISEPRLGMKNSFILLPIMALYKPSTAHGTNICSALLGSSCSKLQPQLILLLLGMPLMTSQGGCSDDFI